MERSESHRKPEGCGAKRRFLPFLCNAKRVTGHGVDSNAITDKVLNKVKFSLIFLTASDKVELETISRDKLQLQNDGKHG